MVTIYDNNVTPAAIGCETVNGFSLAHDVIDFSVALFTNYMAVIRATTQVGLDTVITVDATDSVTLTDVNKATLRSTNFQFKS
jgi:hypothetical protein